MMTLTLEALIGSTPEQCVAELKRLSTLLNVTAACDFNGKQIFVCPGMSEDQALLMFRGRP